MTPPIINPQFKVEKLFGDLGKPTTLVIHHGESARDHDDTEAVRILGSYNTLHRDKGWGGIGYHLAVTTRGSVVKCRPISWKGAHSPPNTGKIGVVLIGSYDRDVPSTAQVTALRWIYHDGASVGVPHGLRIGGHRDFNSTSCPGSKLYALIPRIKAVPVPASKPPVLGVWWKDPAKVKRVQVNADWFFRDQHIPHARITPDGQLGPATKDVVKQVKFLLGYSKPFVVWAVGTYTDTFFRRVHEPTYGLSQAAVKRGLERRNAARKPVNDRAGLASAILRHPNSRFSFWSPTGGSARDGLERTARGEKAYCAATRRYVEIDKRILAFALDLCQVAGGPVLINCLTNGKHMSGSQHYSGQAVDIDKSSHGLSRIYAAASRHGLTVLNEDQYHFHVHV